MLVNIGASLMPGLLTETRNAIRVRQLSLATERAYLGWLRRLIRFHHPRHPRELGKKHIEQLLTRLLVDCKVSPSTQNQALQTEWRRSVRQAAHAQGIALGYGASIDSCIIGPDVAVPGSFNVDFAA